MKIEEPLFLKADVYLPRLKPVSLRVRDLPNPGLEKQLDKVSVIGVDKGARRLEQQLAEALVMANRRLQARVKTRNLRFFADEASGRMVVLLVDQGTGRVVREYPPEKILENAAILKEASVVQRVIG